VRAKVDLQDMHLRSCFVYLAFATLLQTIQIRCNPQLYTPHFLRKTSPVASNFNYVRPQTTSLTKKDETSGTSIADNVFIDRQNSVTQTFLQPAGSSHAQNPDALTENGSPRILDRYHTPVQPALTSTASKNAYVPSITDINRAITIEHQQPEQARQNYLRVRTLDRTAAVAPKSDSAKSRSRQRPRHVSTNRMRQNRQSVSEGHRLITRALWRIFDALMEKNENNAIQERMNFVENALKDLIAHNSKLEGMLEMVKEENLDLNDRLNQISGDMKRIGGKVEDLSEWRSSLVNEQNDEVSPQSFVALTTHRSCPLPFETVNGECFYLGQEEKKGWEDARKECSKFGPGADLAAPKELKSIQDFLNDLQYRPEYVWVGASIQGDGEWVWVTGPKDSQKKVDMSRKTWNVDLPNNSGNCMGLYEGAGYRAYDYHCSEYDFYVCQYFLSP